MVFGLFGSKSKTKNTNESVSNQTVTPNMPGYWLDAAADVNTDLGHIGGRWGLGSVDPAQQAGMDTLTGLSANNAGAKFLNGTTNPQLAALGGQFQTMANQPAHQLSGTAPAVSAPQIAAPGTLSPGNVASRDINSNNVSAGKITSGDIGYNDFGVGNIAAGNVGYNDFGAGTVRSGLIDMPDSIGAERVAGGSAYDNAGSYIDAYGTGVLDPSLVDYDEGTARAANAFRAQAIGGGGQAGGAQPVAAGVLAGEAARGRGALSASIRSDILDKSFGFGGQDSSRRLQADTTNAGNALTAQSQNVANKMGAQSANVANTLAADTTNVSNRLAADSTNAANRLTADTTNVGNRLSADSQNVGNRLSADSTNAANRLTADTTNVGNRLSADSQNVGNSLNSDAMNANNRLAADTTNAANRLTADTTNVGNQLNADSRNIDNAIGVNTSNAANNLTASGQNAAILNSRDMANLQAKISGDATSMSALNALGNIIQTQGSNAITAENQTAQNAIRALEAAGIPLNQALQVIEAQIAGLQGVQGGFGTTATGSDRSSGTGSSSSFGFSASFPKK